MTGNEIKAQQSRAAQRVNSTAPRGAGANLRAALRYALQTDVAFHWVGVDGTSQDGRGQTRDISQKGAYVESSLIQQSGQESGSPSGLLKWPANVPPNGATVKLSISLPAAVDTGKSVRMEAQGRVVRVERDREPRGSVRFGFAVSNDQVSLCTG
jgi:hypothetical protein